MHPRDLAALKAEVNMTADRLQRDRAAAPDLPTRLRALSAIATDGREDLLEAVRLLALLRQIVIAWDMDDVDGFDQFDEAITEARTLLGLKLQERS